MLKIPSLALLLLFSSLWVGCLWAAEDGHYVGSQSCATCHQTQYSQWQQSHHAKAMAEPNEASVLGNFDNQEFVHEDVTARFTQKAGAYFITVKEASAPAETYRVAYTFGYEPLQQYLLDLGDGKFQVYDVAWDSREASQGGQQWFKLLPGHNTGPDTDLHWKRHINNWNSRCAECHSTDVAKEFNTETLVYDTRFHEVNVACEACHGPGQNHVDWAQSNQDHPGKTDPRRSKLPNPLPKASAFQYSGDQAIAQAADIGLAKSVQNSQIDTCGGCHSRRHIINDLEVGGEYHNQYHIALLNEPLYHADGQIQDEVFVLGSFIQSKMYQQGVTCTHCHDAHSGEVKVQGDGLCAQCHSPAVFASQDHHRHPMDSVGSLCVNCHMPATTYMEVDDRRDHSFVIPHGQTTGTSPSPCQNCHDDDVVAWSKNPNPFASLNQQASMANALAWRDITDYIADERQAPIRRATLLAQVGNVPAQLSAETIARFLKDDDPLLRRSAAEAAQLFPPAMRWPVLSPLLDDPSTSVQHAATALLAPTLPTLGDADAKKLRKKLTQYRQQLQINAGTPSGQAALAQLELAMSQPQQALEHLTTALAIEPNYLPALLNMADVYRTLNETQREKQYLERGLSVAPNNASVLHAYGLHLIRQQQMSEALDYLQKATQQTPTNQRYFYVYAVALESVGEQRKAINVLQESDTRWPNQFDTLMTLVQYMESSELADARYPYLSRLSAIAPNHPEVKRRVQAIRAGNSQSTPMN